MNVKSAVAALILSALVATPFVAVTATSAWAGRIEAPVLSTGHAASPAIAFVVIGSAASVLFNAAVTQITQCRQLTSEEAMIAIALPGLGAVYNLAQPAKSACPGAGR